jgi:hypothetical protein
MPMGFIEELCVRISCNWFTELIQWWGLFYRVCLDMRTTESGYEYRRV